MDNSFVEALMLDISNGCTMHSLCNRIAEAVKNPVAFSLSTETLIGYSDDFTEDYITEFSSAPNFMSGDELYAMRQGIEEILATGKPQVRAWPYIRHKQINCGCFYNNVLLGNLIIPVSSTPVEDVDLPYIEAAARCVGIWLAAHGYYKGRAQKDEQFFLKSLLKSDAESRLQRQKTHYLDIYKASSFRLIWVIAEENSDADFQHRIAGLCKYAQKWWHISHESGYAILINALYGQYFKRLNEILIDSKGYACISDEYENIFHTIEHFSICQEVLEIGIAFNPSKRMLFANDYKLMLAFRRAKVKQPSIIFSNKILDNIIRYDELHSSFYLNTLRAYFICNHNYEKMAAKLNIKKNSVFYRMNRLCELFNIDLDDTLQLTGLFYSLLVHDGIL